MQAKIVKLPFRAKRKVLATGAQQKNTLCFIEGGQAYISREHPDLSRPQDYAAFKKDMALFLKKSPRVIACDLHQGYSSSVFVSRFLLEKYKVHAVQHHHAHIASCMAEAGLKNKKVIGVAFDGTGMGDDGTLWGGEFLLCDYSGYKRAAHLDTIPLLGGEQAIREPWRVAAAWLSSICPGRVMSFVPEEKRRDWQLLLQMQIKGVNSPPTSSVGRLFDAASSLILENPKARFEAELAMALEKKAMLYKGPAKGYPFRIRKGAKGYLIGPEPVFKGILSGLKNREPAESLAFKFHLGVAAMIKEVALKLKKDSGVNRVVLSGGVFQNKCLLKMSVELLYNSGFEVFCHNTGSPNDSGVSLGEAAVAAFRE